MFWFDKQNPRVLFADKRVAEKGHITLYPGRNHSVKPSIVADFRNLPFEDKAFKLVVFDPPHLLAGETSFMAKKYGTLKNTDWQTDIRLGFASCWRVLEDYGILIFKWNETSIPLKEILPLCPAAPLFGHKSGKASKTHWLAFMRIPTDKETLNVA